MSNVKAVPEGYGTITPFINVAGAAKAITFYKSAFGATEHARMAGPDGRVVHAELQIGNSRLMLSDAVQDPPSVAAMHLYVDDCDAWVARAKEAGATVIMPATDMFWGDRFARLKDPFGIIWAVATHTRDVSPAEMEKAMKAMMAANKPA